MSEDVKHKTEKSQIIIITQCQSLFLMGNKDASIPAIGILTANANIQIAIRVKKEKKKQANWQVLWTYQLSDHLSKRARLPLHFKTAPIRLVNGLTRTSNNCYNRQPTSQRTPPSHCLGVTSITQKVAQPTRKARIKHQRYLQANSHSGVCFCLSSPSAVFS